MRDISLAIQEHKEKVLELYPERKVLGIFVYGSFNYNCATENSDVDTKAIIIPDVYNLAVKPIKTRVIELENGEHCEVMDIMHLVANFRKQNINFVEVLFTDYCWVNPRWQMFWNNVFKNAAEEIGMYSPSYCVKSICGQAIHTLKQHSGDAKKYANGLRLKYFIEQYSDENVTSYKDCMVLDDAAAEVCMRLKAGIAAPTQKDVDDLIEWFEVIKNLEIKDDADHKAAVDNVLNHAIVDMIRMCDKGGNTKCEI